MLSLELLKHPQEMLTPASRAQQRLARVLTSTVQPKTAEMYSTDTCIYIVCAAGQVANDDPLVGTLGGHECRGAIPLKYGIPTLGVVVRFPQAFINRRDVRHRE